MNSKSSLEALPGRFKRAVLRRHEPSTVMCFAESGSAGQVETSPRLQRPYDRANRCDAVPIHPAGWE